MPTSTGLDGLGVRMSPTGRKTWIVAYRNARRGIVATRRSIGSASALSASSARNMARQIFRPLGERADHANRKADRKRVLEDLSRPCEAQLEPRHVSPARTPVSARHQSSSWLRSDRLYHLGEGLRALQRYCRRPGKRRPESHRQWCPRLAADEGLAPDGFGS